MSVNPFASGIQSQLRHDLPYAWFRWHQADLWYKKGFVHEYGMSSINNKPKSTRKRPHEALIVSQILLEENVGWAKRSVPILQYLMRWMRHEVVVELIRAAE